LRALSVYVREKNPTGSWRYRKIKEGRGVKTGELKGTFYSRPFLNGRQIWKILMASTFKEAKVEATQLGFVLDAQSKGLSVAEAEALNEQNRTTVRSAVDMYLEQKGGKAAKTVFQYRLTLNEFLEAIGPRVR
jgi:hypothetical protein